MVNANSKSSFILQNSKNVNGCDLVTTAHAFPDTEVCNYDAILQKCLNPPPTDGA